MLYAGPHSSTVDPTFVRVQAPYDLHLTARSPAINSGTTDLGVDRDGDPIVPTVDIEGNPIIGLPDIGAYEFVEIEGMD